MGIVADFVRKRFAGKAKNHELTPMNSNQGVRLAAYSNNSLTENEKAVLSNDIKNFNTSLDAFENGTLNSTIPVTVLSNTPSVYRKLDLSDLNFSVSNLKITMPYSVIKKAVGLIPSSFSKTFHNLTIEMLRKLPELLYDPVLILNGDRAKRLEIYVELFDKNSKPVLVALAADYKDKINDFNSAENGFLVNSIRTAFGKDDVNVPIERIKNGFCRYVNMKKAAEWFRAAGSYIPSAGEIISCSPHTIINLGEDSSADRENNQKKYGVTEAAEPGKVRLAKAETDLKLASNTGLKVDNIINSSLLKVLAKFDYAFPLRTENTYESVKKLWNESQDTEFRNFSTCIRAKFSSAGINKTLSNKAIEKSLNNGFSRSQHYLAVANIDRLFQNGELIESRPNKNNDPNIISIKRFCSPFYIVENNKFAEVVLTVKESLLHGNRLYSLELDEIRKPSIPNKEGLDKQANTPAIDGYLNIAEKIEFANM